MGPGAGAGGGSFQHFTEDAAHQEAGAGWPALRDGSAVRPERNTDRASLLWFRGKGSHLSAGHFCSAGSWLNRVAIRSVGW